MLSASRGLVISVLLLCGASSPALAWTSIGHRTVAAIAMILIPEKAARMATILKQLEADNDFIAAASYADDYVGEHDPGHHLNSWHYALLPDNATPFVCGECLLKALPANLAIIQQGGGGKKEAIAIAWVENLVGDLHQPLHMDGRLRGGSLFRVSYRGLKACDEWTKKNPKFSLYDVWDECLLEEFAAGRDPQTLAKELLGDIKTYKGRPEIGHASRRPWLAWGTESHELAVTVAFDGLKEGSDLDDDYITGKGRALEVVKHQLLVAGIRLAFLLDQNFGKP